MKLTRTLVVVPPVAALAGSVVLLIAGPADETPVVRTFERIALSDQFWCEGAHHADFNRDGVQDVVAGPWWWAGPDFKTRHEIYTAQASFAVPLGERTVLQVPGFEGALGRKNTYSDNFFSFPYDFNADGWTDVLVIGFPGKETAWFENPREGGGHWKRHVVFLRTDNESPTFTDLTGDGKPELVCLTQGAYGFAEADWSDTTKPWRWRRISPDRGYGNFTHGLGVGDVNGDGRMDLLEKDGWWEQPASLDGDPVWTHHPHGFSGPGGAQMYAYDVNGDGLNDVITSLAAHAFGLAWFEQTREADGRIGWKERTIMGQRPDENRYGVKFSELHALDLVDMNGDGLKDIVTGKRFWSHGRLGDPDRNDEAVLYWFELTRGPEGVDFVPHRIDANSGVGTQIVAGDINGDRHPDVVVGNKKGVYVLLQQVTAATAEQAAAARPKPLPAPKPAVSTAPTTADGRRLNFDFESGDLTDWTADGEAFAGSVVRGDAVTARRKDMRSGHAGDHWVGGYEKAGDKPTGTLTSAAFPLTQPYLGFLIGGGSSRTTRVELINAASGVVLATATGPDNELMERVFIDVRPWQGAGVQVRLIDEAVDGWGHLNFDDILFYNAPPPKAREAKPQ
ncbi:MAG: FG-GAP repeat domain-containing protein [Verrucomicrobiales bacterium]